MASSCQYGNRSPTIITRSRVLLVVVRSLIRAQMSLIQGFAYLDSLNKLKIAVLGTRFGWAGYRPGRVVRYFCTCLLEIFCVRHSRKMVRAVFCFCAGFCRNVSKRIQTNPKSIRVQKTLQNVLKRIQTCPNVSKRVQTCPKSKRVQKSWSAIVVFHW